MKRAIGVLMGAGNNAAAFSPTNLAGLKLWLKADSLVLSNNDPVSTWSDSSGNGNDVTGTGGQRPLYKTNIQNGLPSVRFDGVDDFLNGGVIATYGTLFVVSNFTGTSPFDDYHAMVATNSRVGGTADAYMFGTQSSTNIYTDNGTPFTATSIYINKVQTVDFATLSTTKIFAGVDSTPASKTSLQLGQDPIQLVNRYWQGDVFEILVYDTALSDTNRNKVEDYLNSKWALF